MNPWRFRWLGLLVVVLAVLGGCDAEPRNVGSKPAKKATPKPAEEDHFIVGKTTQEVKQAAPELQKGARVASTKIVAKDPITLQGNAYVTIIGRTAMDNMKHAVDLFQANEGRYPKDYDEFMTVIIKGNNIALPRLPHYQKYAYDENEHKLIVLEYPDLKGMPPQ